MRRMREKEGEKEGEKAGEKAGEKRPTVPERSRLAGRRGAKSILFRILSSSDILSGFLRLLSFRIEPAEVPKSASRRAANGLPSRPTMPSPFPSSARLDTTVAPRTAACGGRTTRASGIRTAPATTLFCRGALWAIKARGEGEAGGRD